MAIWKRMEVKETNANREECTAGSLQAKLHLSLI